MTEKMKRSKKINWIAVFAILTTLSLYLMSCLSDIRNSIGNNSGDIREIKTDMEWVKNAIKDAKNGDLSYSNNPVMKLFVKK